MQPNLATQAMEALRRKDYAAARDAIGTYGQDHRLEFQHYLIKGLSEMALQGWASARDTFAEATDAFPHQAQLWLNRGVAEENLGAFDEAIKSFGQCLAQNPNQVEAWGNLSNIYRKQARFAEAEAAAHRAAECSDKDKSGAAKALALNCLGLALGKQGKFTEAEDALQHARQLDPGSADILVNLANLAVDRLDFASAWLFFAAARAAENKPTIRRDEGMARLLSGDDAGWQLYELRLDLPTSFRHPPVLPDLARRTIDGQKTDAAG